MNPSFPLLALWGNKNCPPSMKVKEVKKFECKSGILGCIWFNLSFPGTEKHLSHHALEFAIIGLLIPFQCARIALLSGAEEREGAERVII